MNCDDHRQGTRVAVVGWTEQVNKHKKHHQLPEGQPSSFTPWDVQIAVGHCFFESDGLFIAGGSRRRFQGGRCFAMEVGVEIFWNWSYLTFLQEDGLVGSSMVMLMLPGLVFSSGPLLLSGLTQFSNAEVGIQRPQWESIDRSWNWCWWYYNRSIIGCAKNL